MDAETPDFNTTNRLSTPEEEADFRAKINERMKAVDDEQTAINDQAGRVNDALSPEVDNVKAINDDLSTGKTDPGTIAKNAKALDTSVLNVEGGQLAGNEGRWIGYRSRDNYVQAAQIRLDIATHLGPNVTREDVDNYLKDPETYKMTAKTDNVDALALTSKEYSQNVLAAQKRLTNAYLDEDLGIDQDPAANSAMAGLSKTLNDVPADDSQLSQINLVEPYRASDGLAYANGKPLETWEMAETTRKAAFSLPILPDPTVDSTAPIVSDNASRKQLEDRYKYLTGEKIQTMDDANARMISLSGDINKADFGQVTSIPDLDKFINTQVQPFFDKVYRDHVYANVVSGEDTSGLTDEEKKDLIDPDTGKSYLADDKEAVEKQQMEMDEIQQRLGYDDNKLAHLISQEARGQLDTVAKANINASNELVGAMKAYQTKANDFAGKLIEGWDESRKSEKLDKQLAMASIVLSAIGSVGVGGNAIIQTFTQDMRKAFKGFDGLSKSTLPLLAGTSKQRADLSAIANQWLLRSGQVINVGSATSLPFIINGRKYASLQELDEDLHKDADTWNNNMKTLYERVQKRLDDEVTFSDNHFDCETCF